MNFKRIFNGLIVLLAAITMFSCRSSKTNNGSVSLPGKRPVATTTSNTGHLPPGHAKKLNGDQSARAYAPGQQKKKAKGKSKVKKAKARK